MVWGRLGFQIQSHGTFPSQLTMFAFTAVYVCHFGSILSASKTRPSSPKEQIAATLVCSSGKLQICMDFLLFHFFTLSTIPNETDFGFCWKPGE
jgi:Na+(H+)/acetate symporter ActP